MFIFSCEDEPVQLSEWTQLRHGTNDFIYWKNINDYPNVKDYAISLSKTRIGNQLRTESTTTTNFTILEHIDAYIYTDSLATTYTLAIQKANQTEFGFSNLVIKYVDDEPSEAFILNYVPTQEYLNSYIEYNQTTFEGTVGYELLGNSVGRAQMFCQMVSTTYCCFNNAEPGELNYCGEPHVAGTGCSRRYMWTESTLVCEDDPTVVTIDAGGSGGGGTLDPNENPHTTPIPSDPCTTQRGDVGLSNGNDCLDAPTEDCEDESSLLAEINALPNSVFKTEATNYYTENNEDCSSLEFLVLAVDAHNNDGEVDFEENIIYDSTFNNYPCHKLVVQDAIGVCSPLTQSVLDAFEANDGTNLIFEVSNTISGNGNTSSSSVYNPINNTCNITIKIRESYLQNATDLSIARTVIHESLHAMFVYMFEEGLLVSEDGTSLDGFEELIEAHINHMSNLPLNLGATHHELMSDFVEDMATSLSTYGSSQGYSNSFNFYKKLCWSGAMVSTPSFQAIYPQYIVPSDATNNPNNLNPDWLDIINTDAAEQDNATFTFAHPNGNTYIHSPQGN